MTFVNLYDYNSHVPSPIGGKIILELYLTPYAQINPKGVKEGNVKAIKTKGKLVLDRGFCKPGTETNSQCSVIK